MNKKTFTIIISAIIVLLIGAGILWYLFFSNSGTATPISTGNSSSGGFQPYTTSSSLPIGSSNGTTSNTTAQQTPTTVSPTVIPSLRLLSNSPIGGYGASTTASTTIIRWIDRGRGNIFETKGSSLTVTTLSNTILPRMYESIWNKNITSLIGSLLPSGDTVPTVIYANMESSVIATSPTPSPKASAAKSSASRNATSTLATSTDAISRQASSTQQTAISANIAPYVLKGKNLPSNTIAYAVSPKGDKIFMLIEENNSGTGYISNFDGTSVVKIFSTPLTKLNVEWPEDSTIAVTTKGSSGADGYLYFIDPKTGIWKKIIGPLSGLSTRVSHNAKYVIASWSDSNQNMATNIYKIGTTTPMEATVQTIADKCVWGNFYKEIVYCGVPFQPDTATYPDDWYKGNISFTDRIWQINATNNEAHLVTSIIDQSNRIIDAFNLGLDAKDHYLFFMNKNDLSFWSFDLTAKR